MQYLKKYFTFGKDFLELLTHSKNYITGEILTKGLVFLTMPLFTRLMTPEEYGVMSVFLSFTGILAIIFGFGIRGAVSRYYYEEKKDFYAYFSSNFWFVIIGSFVLMGIAILFQNPLQAFLNIPKGMIYFSFGIVIPRVIFELYQAYLRASKRSKKVASLNIIRAFISIGLATVILFQMTDERYYARAVGEGIAYFIVMFIILWSLKKYITLSIKKEHLNYSLIFGLPIVLHLLSQNILNTFDQVIINQLVGKYETGIYSVSYKTGMIQNIISMGILKAWTPIFYEKMNYNKHADIRALSKKYGFIVMIVAIFLIFFSREIISILADKSYHEALFIIPIIVVSYFFFFLYTMYVNFSFYSKKTQNIAIITIIAGGINVFLNYLLIPKFGYAVAAWTTLISYFLLFILHYTNVRWILKIKMITDVKIFIWPVTILAVISFLHYLLTISDFSYLFSLILRIITLLFIVYLTYKRVVIKTL
jgi:O-antigen/teichoic acid export membrane protein